HILYVEDDESLSFVTRDHLELQGYQVTHCPDGRTAEVAIEQGEFDICLLDVMLPETDGFALARKIRQQNTQVPILFLTAKSLKEDRLHGLRLGADDYITKPFSIEELILKIEVFLRRSRVVDAPPPSEFQLGNYVFNYKNLELRLSEDVRRLTQKEADLLRYLIQHKNQVVKRGDILEEIWGENDYFLGRSLDVFISRLRKYLRGDESLRVENIHGVGFCFHV
ncbi:MAG: response regulator transcription factor, partial [Bacteroidota bacterium]